MLKLAERLLDQVRCALGGAGECFGAERRWRRGRFMLGGRSGVKAMIKAKE